MSPAYRYLSGWIFCLLASLANGSEVTLEDLRNAGRLQVDSSLSIDGDIVPRQKVQLVLKIATDRWFTGGTRIVIPEVPGLVILQTEQLASNASENRGGETWIIQNWYLDVYPQRDGDFTIPPVELKLMVHADASEPVSGSIFSREVRFSAATPAALKDHGDWVAAPSLRVSQHFDRSLENLQVGDAIERDIVFKATDVMAMMLPAFRSKSPVGLAAYPAPPELKDRSNRGQTVATRSQRISYVMETEGNYVLPGAVFAWWDTGNGQLETLSIPATELTVGAVTGSTGEDTAWYDTGLIRLCGALVAIIILLWPIRAVLNKIGVAQKKHYSRRLAAFLQRGWRILSRLWQPALGHVLNPLQSESATLPENAGNTE